ncbi:MAG TPA: ComF family protein [Candidatus Sulfotelmatobacter sp.]
MPGQLCSVCGERVLSPHIVSVADGQKLCPACSHATQHFAKAVAFGSYEGVLRELVHLLKYSGVRPAASVLGKLLAEAISGRGLFREAGPELSPVLVVPVPLYRSKRSERGFNHAESIAQAALKLLTNEQRVGRELVLRQDILERSRATQSQTGLTIKQRRENVRGAFAVRRAQEVNGREVLLVDDVYTTGATVSECARVLRRAGAEKVWVATVARTLKLASRYGEMKPALGVVSPEMAETPLARAVG